MDIELSSLWLTVALGSGGEEVLLDVGGQDATEAFEDVGHSDEAREILEGLLAGNLKRVVRPDNSTTLIFAAPFYAPRLAIRWARYVQNKWLTL